VFHTPQPSDVQAFYITVAKDQNLCEEVRLSSMILLMHQGMPSSTSNVLFNFGMKTGVAPCGRQSYYGNDSQRVQTLFLYSAYLIQAFFM
jgi:hypothetical protein